MTDILNEILDENLPKLADIYKKHVNWAPHVLSLVHTGIRWRKSQKYRHCIKFLSVGDSWEKDGTVVVLMEFGCYDIFVFTLDEECTNLRQGLIQTNLLNFSTTNGSFFCVHEKHVCTLLQIAEDKNIKLSYAIAPYIMLALPPEKEISINYPSGVYVKKIDASLANQINSFWLYSSPGSDLKYLYSLLEMNGGFGVFLEGTNEIVAWILKHCLGHIGMLHTKEEYRKNGYAILITKFLAEEIRKDGSCPFATIYSDNVASIRMFEKIGFQTIGTCAYLNFKNK
ncbi:uncharacterized protein LOC123011912 [Tribolium madens]|uniref:uncharacterized protein LOC123011912 n=1 Tax=Tribolium madens TaxID=41895 RepID=UPI001CF73936|nr:uncharacterized protein LOC123011912 [Tribolium madens]